MKSYVFSAFSDKRFRADRHFLLSDINSELVKKSGLTMTVAEFRALVMQATPAFITYTGNLKLAPLMRVNVYDINDFKSEVK